MSHTLNTHHQLNGPKPASQTGRSSNENRNNEQLLFCSFCNRQFDNKTSLTNHIANHVRLHKRYFSGSRFSPRFCKGGSHMAEVKSTGNDEKYNFQIRHNQHTAVSQEARSKKSFTCAHCGQYFTRKINLIRHIKIHIEKNLTLFPSSIQSLRQGASRQVISNKGFTCPNCGGSFTRKDNLERHIKSYTNRKSFPCRACTSSFSRNCSLKRHMMIHANEKPFSCPTCGRPFNDESNLRNHITTHTNEKPFSCPTCRRSFTCISYLKSHIRTHTNVKPLAYPSSNHESSLDTHIGTHVNEKSFVCSTCNCSYSSSVTLKNHIKTHTNERLFTCSTCSRSFSRSAHLKRHVKIHTNERPFTCSVCSHSFIEKQDLKNHIRTHTLERPFSCPLCNCSFSRKANLIRHMKVLPKEVPESYPLYEHLNGSQRRLDNLIEQHSEIKDLSCHSCKRSFQVKNNLRFHVQTHMEMESSNQNDNLRTTNQV